MEFDFADDLLTADLNAAALCDDRHSVPQQPHPRRQTEQNEQGRQQLKSVGRSTIYQRRWREKGKRRREHLLQKAAELSAQLDAVLQEKQALETETQALALAMHRSEPDNDREMARLFIPSEGCSESLSITGTGDILLKELLDTPTRLSREEVLKMSLHDHCILHKGLVLRASKLLLQNPAQDPDSEAGRRLMALFLEKHGLWAYCSAAKRLMMHRLAALRRFDTALRAEAQPPDWASIARSLALSPEQQAALLNWRQEYVQDTQAVLQDRQSLQSIAEELDTSQHTEWAALSRALNDSVDEEHLIWMRFYGNVWNVPYQRDKLAISVFQEAYLFILSYPFYPDILSICSELAAGPCEALTTQITRPAYSLPSCMGIPDPIEKKIVNRIFKDSSL